MLFLQNSYRFLSKLTQNWLKMVTVIALYFFFYSSICVNASDIDRKYEMKGREHVSNKIK